jgi:hypothetical protein
MSKFIRMNRMFAFITKWFEPKYRIKEIRENGSTKYIPQYRRLFIWSDYLQYDDDYGYFFVESLVYKTFTEADEWLKGQIKIEWEEREERLHRKKVVYHPVEHRTRKERVRDLTENCDIF